MTNGNGAPWWLVGVGVAVGLVVGWLAAPEGPRSNPQQRSLDANLWMQTSGEYRACCLQAYRLGEDRLELKLATRKKTKEKARPAVIMDLDETVLDNSRYETFLYQSGQAAGNTSWHDWEKNHFKDVLLVPGARAFINKAEKAGVTVVYISNRSEENRAYTIRALQHAGLNTTDIDRRLLLSKGPGDKTARRKEVEDHYDVLLLFGDNLRDFNEEFKAPALAAEPAEQNKAIAARLNEVDSERKHWGEDWIILPNPVYGEWTKLIGQRPLENMRPKMQEP